MISGKVDINGHNIIEWSATNEGESGYENHCRYDVNATGRSPKGHKFIYDFSVIHDPRQGAEMLVSYIMVGISQRHAIHYDFRVDL